MRLREKTALITSALVVLCGSLAPAPRDDLKDRVAALGKERLAVIRQAIDIERRRIDIGQATTEAARMWTRRLVEAHRQAGTGKDEYIAALKELVAYEEKSLAVLKDRFQQGGVTQLAVLDGQDSLLQAKILLEEAQAK